MQCAWSPWSLPTRLPEVMRPFKFIIRNSQDPELADFPGFGEAEKGRIGKNEPELPGIAVELAAELPELPP